MKSSKEVKTTKKVTKIDAKEEISLYAVVSDFSKVIKGNSMQKADAEALALAGGYRTVKQEEVNNLLSNGYILASI